MSVGVQDTLWVVVVLLVAAVCLWYVRAGFREGMPCSWWEVYSPRPGSPWRRCCTGGWCGDRDAADGPSEASQGRGVHS